ncbi:MAG: cation:proton antiporter [archaeon]|nr:cation:proton antiporter [Nanoarchaeota archaeon]
MAMVVDDMFLQLALVVTIAAFAAFIARLFKQPQLLAYVLVGVVIGPIFHLVTDASIINSMSTIGIAFLLFLVGLEVDLKKLKDVALVSTIGGSIQIALLFLLATSISLALGFVYKEAMFIGLILAFSSTMIVMKFLSDKRELNTLHGRIVVGILLIEDVFAILALSILSSLNGVESSLVLALLKFVSFFVIAYLCSKFIFPYVFKFAAKFQELLLITSLAICFLFSFTFHYMGFSVIIGAFVAGLTLGNLEYNYEIIGKVKSLRDFFSLLFFVSLGMALSLGVLKNLIVPLIVFLLFILVLKPIITMTICSVFKYTKKPSFISAIYLTQVGEFSLIIATQGLFAGIISQDIYSFVVILALLTITFTSYLTKYNNFLFKILEKPLRIYDRFNTEGLEYLPTKIKPSVVLCGHNRVGYSILKSFKNIKKKVLIVDYNPEVISRLYKEGYHCIYGEVDDDEILSRMNLKGLKQLISTVPSDDSNRYLIKRTRAVNKNAKIIVTAGNIEDALQLYKVGADYVILPHFLGGKHVAELITKVRKKEIKLKDEREFHIKELEERKSMGHEHPNENK